MENGKMRWIHWLVGILWAVIFFSIATIAAAVVENDRIREREDKAIQAQVTATQVTVAQMQECVKALKDNVGEIKLDDKTILRAVK